MIQKELPIALDKIWSFSAFTVRELCADLASACTFANRNRGALSLSLKIITVWRQEIGNYYNV